LCTVILIML